MGKKKRSRKLTVYCSIEGKEEASLLEYLKEIYSDVNTMSFFANPKKGGNPDRIVGFARKNSHYDRSFAWIDEDVDLSKEARQTLEQSWCLNSKASKEIVSCPLKEIQNKFNPENRNPVLIVSHPVCVEGLILKVLGKESKKTYDKSKRYNQIKNLKKTWDDVRGRLSSLEYFKAHLNKDILEVRRKQIPELDLLIKMISK